MNAKRLSPAQFVLLLAMITAAAMLVAGGILSIQSDLAIADQIKNGRVDLCDRIPVGIWVPDHLQQQIRSECDLPTYEPVRRWMLP